MQRIALFTVLAACSVPTARLTDASIDASLHGHVSGLAGHGLVLVDQTGEELSIKADGDFAFSTTVETGMPFAVSVKTQPTAPSQTCSVENGSGVIASTEPAIAITCTTDTFLIGGSVMGLLGSGLVLQQNGGDDLPIAADGTFAFAQKVASGAAYSVTVKTQPKNPAQTCTLVGAEGDVGDGNVMTATVTCHTNAFTVGGTVSGLAGAGLVLENNGGDDLAIAADGSFTFQAPIASGHPYSVTVLAQPNNPSQTCTVTSGAGTINSGPVSNVSINCVTRSFAISGTVTGLAGSGLVLRDNGGDDLPITANGSFTFAAKVASGDTYNVTVATNPTGPTQSCTVTNGSSTVGSANITSVAVSCATNKYTIGGTISGLQGSGLVLRDNNGDDLGVSANGSFTFGTPIASGASYAVTVAIQPKTPAQTCTVSSGTGTVGGANVASVSIACATNAYKIGGTVTGLQGTGLVLQDNNGDNLPISANGAFLFSTSVLSGATYNVTVYAQPTGPAQTCSVSAGMGTVDAANFTGVVVSCAVNQYTIGGTVNGLLGSGLVLQNNGTNDLVVAGPGTFAFTTTIPSGGAYAVTVKTQPTGPWQTCVVASGGSGAVGMTNVTDVVINCTTNKYSIGGTVTGLAGSGLVLQNGTETLPIGANGQFTFPTQLASGGTYGVTISAQPTSPSQTCAVASGSGTIAGTNVTNISVSCTTNTYSIAGQVSGLAGGAVKLVDNGADLLTITANGTFQFATKLPSGQAYNVTVNAQPTNPWQTCTVAMGSGTVTTANVTSVIVSCTTNTYAIGGTVTGLAAGANVTLQNTINSSTNENLTINTNGAFAFPTAPPSGSVYSVAVLIQPTNPWQTCTVSSGSGTISGQNITNIAVSCTTNTYSIGGAITGLSGSGLKLLDNNGDAILPSAGATTFTFPTKIASGQPYSVTVAAQPGSPAQTCAVSNGSGTVAGGNVTSVSIACTTNTYQLTWTTTNGTISPSPTGTSCGTNCMSYTWGTPVTLAANGSAGYYLHAWGGDCATSAKSLQCSLTMTAAHAVSATFTPANYAFVTSTVQWPNSVTPTSSLDATCQAAAQAAGLPGHYVGWSGYGLQSSFASRLNGANGWVRVDNKPFAVSLAALVPPGGFGGNGHSLYPLNVDEHGAGVDPTALVLSGWTFGSSVNLDCSGFTATTGGYAPGRAGGGWLSTGADDNDYQGTPCGTPVRYYCFGNDYDVNMTTYPRATGRYAFAATRVTPGSGVAGLDAACNSQASAAGLPGTYLAMVATTTASAASRFNTFGSPWMRTDGVPIVAAANNLFATTGPNLIATIDVDANGNLFSGSAPPEVYVGAPNLFQPSSATNTCNDWTNTAGSALDGNPGAPAARLVYDNHALPCNSTWALGVYCLQQ